MAIAIDVRDGHAHGPPDATVVRGGQEDAGCCSSGWGLQEDGYSARVAGEALAGHGDIPVAIPVQVAHGEGRGAVARGVVDRREEGSCRGALYQHAQPLVARIDGRAEVGSEQVQLSVAVEVRRLDGDGLDAGG